MNTIFNNNSSVCRSEGHQVTDPHAGGNARWPDVSTRWPGVRPSDEDDDFFVRKRDNSTALTQLDESVCA